MGVGTGVSVGNGVGVLVGFGVKVVVGTAVAVSVGSVISVGITSTVAVGASAVVVQPAINKQKIVMRMMFRYPFMISSWKTIIYNLLSKLNFFVVIVS